MSDEDRRFVSYLVDRLRYFDTARRYLDHLESERPDRRELATIDQFRIDILRAEGRNDDALEALEEYKKKYPDDPRAALASLEALGATFEKVTKAIEAALVAGNPSEREQRLRAAITLFQDTVRAPLDAMITGFGEPTDDATRERRNRAELARIRFLLLFANVLPEEREERRRALEEGLAFATSFVETRAYFPIMQYEALVQKGIFLLELERFSEAASELSVLYDVVPNVRPPYPPVLIGAIKDLRLKAILFGVRGHNGAGEYNLALQVINRYLRNANPRDPFSLSGAEEDPAFRRYIILLRLEEGIALAGAGQVEDGLGRIHKVIEEQSGRGEDGAPFVIDARVALGKIADAGGIVLSGRDYFEIGFGKLSESRGKPTLLEGALLAFQRALTTLTPRDVAEYAPRCLDEIGQIHHMLGRELEAAIAFREIAVRFPTTEDVGKAAKYYLASINSVRNTRTNQGALGEMFAEAQQLVELHGGGEGFPDLQARMAEAQRARVDGRFEDAKKIYAEIPRERDGKKVPFYWRARFSALWIPVLEWESSQNEAAKEAFPEAIAGIEANLPTAIAEKDLLGAAVGAFALGQMHYHLGNYAESVAALKVFLGELAEDTYVRCEALGYLVTSAVEGNDESAAIEAFRALSADCPDHIARGYAALTLSDHFSGLSGPTAQKKAAAYMLVYVQSSVFANDVDRLRGADLADTYLRVARVLIEGGFVDEAKKYIDLAESTVGPGELERQLLYLRALTAEQADDWIEVIRNLRQYVKEYKGDGSHFEDPYVWRKLGYAYYKVDSDAKARKASNLRQSEKYFNIARSLLARAVQANPQDEPLARQYWTWAYEWVTVKLACGRDLPSAPDLRGIVAFVDEWKYTEMGGRREEFLKRQEQAKAQLRRMK